MPAYLAEVERNTHLYTLRPQMLCGAMQGRLLSWLVAWLRPLVCDRPFRILEIGTFTGYSALCFAERLSAGDEVHTVEIEEELERLIRQHFQISGFAERLTLHIGDGSQLLEELPGPWDLVYLDARKDDYPRQFEEASRRLAPGGHILLDNMLWDGQVWQRRHASRTATLLRDFTKQLAADERWETLLLPMRDGLMLVRERV